MTPEQVGQLIKAELDRKLVTRNSRAFTLNGNLKYNVFGERCPCPLLFVADQVTGVEVEPTVAAMAKALDITVDQASRFITSFDSLGKNCLVDAWSRMANECYEYAVALVNGEGNVNDVQLNWPTGGTGRIARDI
jgi:hypothetical protein